jgi:hypothetical protein
MDLARACSQAVTRLHAAIDRRVDAQLHALYCPTFPASNRDLVEQMTGSLDDDAFDDVLVTPLSLPARVQLQALAKRLSVLADALAVCGTAEYAGAIVHRLLEDGRAGRDLVLRWL